MAKGLPFDIAVVFMVIVCAAIVAGQGEEEEKRTGPYDSIMVSIRWPKAFCTAVYEGAISFDCTGPMVRYPTLRGIWLMYDRSHLVRSYDENPECTQSEPLDHITYDLIRPIFRDMKEYWSDLIRATYTTNLHLWDNQWQYHGKCFFDNKNPIPFFKIGLDIIKYNDILEILKEGGVEPNNEYYEGRKIAKALFMHFHVRITICCSKNKDGIIQLDNIRICLSWSGNSLISCKDRFLRCPNNEDQLINFPAP